MITTNITGSPGTHCFQGTEPFRVAKAMKLNGVAMQVGDFLPADAEVRSNPRRMEVLIRQRFLERTLDEPSVSQVTAPSSEPAQAGEETVEIDLDQLGREELHQLATQYGIDAGGNAATLRKRIRAALG